MLATALPQFGAFVKVLPPEPAPRALRACTDRHFAEVDAHRQIAAILLAFEALYAIKRQTFWARQAPTKRRMVPVARAMNPRPMIAVTVLDTCPRGRAVRGEYQPRTARLPLYAYTCDAATPHGYEANPDSWRVESAFQGSTGYVGGLADALAGPEAELAGFAPELRAAKEAYAEATTGGSDADGVYVSPGGAEYQAQRNRWGEDRGEGGVAYAGFAQDLDETYLDYREDHDALRAEYEAVQRTLRRICTGRIQFEHPDQKEAAIVRHRSRLMALRVEKEALVARWAMIVQEAA